MANVQRGAYDEAERELKLTMPRSAGRALGYVDVRHRGARGDRARPRRRRYRPAACGARPRPRCGTRARQEPGDDLSRLDTWALQVQAIAVVAHAHHGRLGLVAEITGALPAALSGADRGPGPAAWDALQPPMTSPSAARCCWPWPWPTSTGASARRTPTPARSGARMIALAERFGFKSGLQPTMSAARARRAAQDADGQAYADAVSVVRRPRPGRPARRRSAPRCRREPRSAVDVPPEQDPCPQVPGQREAGAPGDGGERAAADRARPSAARGGCR